MEGCEPVWRRGRILTIASFEGPMIFRVNYIYRCFLKWWYPPKHPKMINFSRKTPWLLGTTISGNPQIATVWVSHGFPDVPWKFPNEICGFSRHCGGCCRDESNFEKTRKNRHSAKMQTIKNWVTKLKYLWNHFKRIFESFVFITWKYLLTFSRWCWFLSFCWKCENFAVLRRWRWNPGHQKRQIWRQAVLLRRPRLKFWSKTPPGRVVKWCLMMINSCMDKNPHKTKRFFWLHHFFGLNKFFPPVFRLGKSWAFISSGQQPSEPRCRNPAAKVAQGPLKEWSWEPSLVHAIPNWKKDDVRIKTMIY